MVRLEGSFGRLKPSRILVVGDLVLDTYTIGKAQRISPEAPVAVVKVTYEEHRPGMAGNVVLNLLALSAEVSLLGRVGNDDEGKLLCATLHKDGADVSGIVVEEGYPTPVKNRVISDHQQIVRVDRETTPSLSPALQDTLIAQVPELLKDVDLIAISDYGKGFLTEELLQALITEANTRKIPTVIDPKGVDFRKYRGATVIKPNFGEALVAANLTPESSLEEVAKEILNITEAQTLMITRSQDGISLFSQGKQTLNYPVKVRQVKDVTGAGDTVLAMVSCALASGLDIAEAAQLANVAAGIAIERLGCAHVSLSDLARRLLKSNSGNKVFDEEHLFALQKALAGHKIAVVGLSGEEGLSTETFALLHELHKRDNWSIVVYVRDEEPDPHFVELLVSLREVDFITLKSDNLRHFCKSISPDEVLVVEEGQVKELAHSGELVLV